MSLLIFALIVVVVLALVLWAISMIPIPSPANWLIQVLAVLIAAVAIANKAGLF